MSECDGFLGPSTPTFAPIAEIRLMGWSGLMDYARNGFQDSRDKKPKNAHKRLYVTAETTPRAPQPAKARRFEVFVTASETLGTTRTAWWRTQSHANSSLPANSLLTGKRTGNFGEFALSARF